MPYIKFLTAKAGSAKLDLGLDVTALRLLERIAVGNFNDKALTVSDLMGMKSIASPATVHRKRQDLIKADLVATHHLNSNKRTKYLVPTDKAITHFDRLGNLLVKAISTGQCNKS